MRNGQEKFPTHWVRRSAALLLVLCGTTWVFAQDETPGGPRAKGKGGGGRGAVRAPNVPNMRGTDSGQGPACEVLTTYGQVQPPGIAPFPYGPGTPPPPEVPEMTYGRPTPASATSNLGAAGIPTRGTVVPEAPMIPHKFLEAPNPPLGTPAFANVNSVQLLKNGHLIVNQRMPMFQLLEYDENNRLVRNINPNLLARPHGMRVDKEDNIWVTDQQCNMVIKLRPTGEVLLTLGTRGKAGAWDEAKGQRLFNQPTDVAFAPNGDVLVSVGHGGPDPAVVRFDKTGKFLNTWSLKHADGSQAVIHTLVVSSKSEVWVGDREIKKLLVFDLNGKLLREFPMKNLICGLYVDSKDQLWMTTGMDGMILRLDWNAKILGYVGKSGFGATEFGEAHYLTISPEGKTMFVSDTVNNDIKKIQLTN